MSELQCQKSHIHGIKYNFFKMEIKVDSDTLLGIIMDVDRRNFKLQKIKIRQIICSSFLI